jgi:hypothetical protein
MSRTRSRDCTRTLLWSPAVLGGLLIVGMANRGFDVRAEERPPDPDTVGLTVRAYSDHRDNPKLVMVTLLSNGKAIRSRQLDSGWFTSEKTHKEVTWDKLPVGAYELQFQADGYEKSVYQIALSKDDKQLKVGVPEMKKTGIGDDPAFRHLVERVMKLEAANADLRGSAARLQRELDELRKR